MVVSALKTLLPALFLLLAVQVPAGLACFGPKLFVGVLPGLEEEMRYYLVSIYLHEKTGIDTVRVELKEGRTAIDAIAAHEIDLGFAADSATETVAVLQLDDGFKLYTGERPLTDLQFSTVGRVFAKLQNRLDQNNLDLIRQAIKAGSLPATAVRDFMLKNGWI
jgi:hypothetical protein